MSGSDWVQIITAFFTLLGLIVSGYVAIRMALLSQKVEVVHKATNSIVKDIGDAREEIGKYKEQSAERARADAASEPSKSVLEKMDDMSEEIPEETAKRVVEKLEE